MLKRALFRVASDEDGAVTVDWVVLTAAMVLLGVAAAGQIASGTTQLATAVGGCAEGAGDAMRWNLKKRPENHGKALERMGKRCAKGG